MDVKYFSIFSSKRQYFSRSAVRMNYKQNLENVTGKLHTFILKNYI